MARPTTSKAARAAYKARPSTNVLSDREKKQLERAVVLDRRAWGVKEREKKKAEAAKKRAELEREEREERARIGVKATQRARDRFGFRGSQRCLGAWFGNGSKPGTGRQLGNVREGEEDQHAETWDEVDEESLMEVLEDPLHLDQDTEEAHEAATDCGWTTGVGDDRAMNILPRPLSNEQRVHTVTKPHETTERMPTLDEEWDDELLSDYVPTQRAPKGPGSSERPAIATPTKAHIQQAPSITTSFGSMDFTEEDLEALDATVLASSPVKAMPVSPRTMMSPPALPSRTTRPAPQRDKARSLAMSISLPTPARPAGRGSGYGASSFTLTQLESFVEEDLQLTQV